MSRRIAIGTLVACGTLLWAVRGDASDHLVTARRARADLVRSAEGRAAEIAAVQRALSTPAAGRTARSLSVSLDRVRAAVPSLTDEELHELAARAEAVEADPAAGHVDPWVNDVVVVILIVGIVALVLGAV
jgi:hypothetical protein